MKTVNYTLRLEADVFLDSMTHGLHALSPFSEMDAVISDTWEKLGPAPDIDYDKL
ncbi:MAG: hypothetical protein ACLQU4_05035 [Limisphaerales bacterium]